MKTTTVSKIPHAHSLTRIAYALPVENLQKKRLVMRHSRSLPADCDICARSL